MTPDQATKIYNSLKRETDCLEYLKAASLVEIGVCKDLQPEPEFMLAALLASGTVFLNTHWWKVEWPEDARKTIALCVNCKGIFARGVADETDLNHDEIHSLFDHWAKDQHYGAAVWCMKKRNRMPQKPVEQIIRAAGIWDIDEMGLAPNP